MTTLLHERGTLGFALQAALEVQIRKLVSLARDRGADPLQRDRIAREWIEMQGVRFTNYRSLSALMKTGLPGPEGSISKLVWSEANQRVTKLALEILGPDAALGEDNAPYGGYWQYQQLRSRGNTIEAGTSEVLRNIVAERVLGLPYSRCMDFTFTPEQEALREQAREFLAATPEPTWAQLAELGWTGVSIAEEDGGAGLSFLEEAVLFEELGRALYRGPYFATIGMTLPALPAEDRAAVAAGEASWTLAFGPLVPDLDSAEHVAIVGGDGIYELEGGEREILSTTDESRTLGVVRGGEAGRRLADSGVLSEIEARSQTALALEACGVARLALEDALEYASSREQFGKKIGVYQAVSHPLADAYTRVELSRSLALWAAWCVATGDAQASIAAAAAKSVRGRERRFGVRDGDPVSRRDRLHLGAPAPSAVQACTRHRELRRIGYALAGGDRRLTDRAGRGVQREPDTGDDHTRRLGSDGRPDDGLPAQRAGDPPPRRRALRRQRDREPPARQELAHLHVRRLRLAHEEAHRRAARSSASRTATASGRSCGTTRSTSRRTWVRRSAGSSRTR